MKNCEDCLERIDRAIKTLKVTVKHWERLKADIITAMKEKKK